MGKNTIIAQGSTLDWELLQTTRQVTSHIHHVQQQKGTDESMLKLFENIIVDDLVFASEESNTKMLNVVRGGQTVARVLAQMCDVFGDMPSILDIFLYHDGISPPDFNIGN